jgi:hypothetical protein
MAMKNPDPEAVGRFVFLVTVAGAVAFAIAAYLLIA